MSRRLPDDQLTNPESIRSRERRALAKANRRDPLQQLRPRFPSSAIDALTLRLRAKRPDDAARPIDERQWHRELEAEITRIVLDTLKDQGRK